MIRRIKTPNDGILPVTLTMCVVEFLIGRRWSMIYKVNPKPENSPQRLSLIGCPSSESAFLILSSSNSFLGRSDDYVCADNYKEAKNCAISFVLNKTGSNDELEELWKLEEIFFSLAGKSYRMHRRQYVNDPENLA